MPGRRYGSRPLPCLRAPVSVPLLEGAFLQRKFKVALFKTSSSETHSCLCVQAINPGIRLMESDSNKKWPYAIMATGMLIACIGFALREAVLLGWL